jgi:hypothetical protein
MYSGVHGIAIVDQPKTTQNVKHKSPYRGQVNLVGMLHLARIVSSQAPPCKEKALVMKALVTEVCSLSYTQQLHCQPVSLQAWALLQSSSTVQAAIQQQSQQYEALQVRLETCSLPQNKLTQAYLITPCNGHQAH